LHIRAGLHGNQQNVDVDQRGGHDPATVDLERELEGPVVQYGIGLDAIGCRDDADQRNQDRHHRAQREGDEFIPEGERPDDLGEACGGEGVPNSRDDQVAGSVAWQDLDDGENEFRQEDDAPDRERERRRRHKRLVLDRQFSVGWEKVQRIDAENDQGVERVCDDVHDVERRDLVGRRRVVAA